MHQCTRFVYSVCMCFAYKLLLASMMIILLWIGQQLNSFFFVLLLLFFSKQRCQSYAYQMIVSSCSMIHSWEPACRWSKILRFTMYQWLGAFYVTFSANQNNYNASAQTYCVRAAELTMATSLIAARCVWWVTFVLVVQCTSFSQFYCSIFFFVECSMTFKHIACISNGIIKVILIFST